MFIGALVWGVLAVGCVDGMGGAKVLVEGAVVVGDVGLNGGGSKGVGGALGSVGLDLGKRSGQLA